MELDGSAFSVMNFNTNNLNVRTTLSVQTHTVSRFDTDVILTMTVRLEKTRQNV